MLPWSIFTIYPAQSAGVRVSAFFRSGTRATCITIATSSFERPHSASRTDSPTMFRSNGSTAQAAGRGHGCNSRGGALGF
jgi:hypothetical protein